MAPGVLSARRTVEPALLAKSLLEPGIVAYGSEVVVPAGLLAEPGQQLDGPSEVTERLIAGVARERREARVVVVQAWVVRRALKAAADGFERVAVALLAVGTHGLVLKRPRVTPVERLVRLAGCGADGEDGSVPPRLAPRVGRDDDERPCGRVDRLTIDLEGRVPVEHEVQLLLARPGLVVLADQRAVLAGRIGVDPECVNPEV